MTIIWLNGAVGAGKSAVGRALAALVPGAAFLDGDDIARDETTGPVRWRRAMDAMLRIVPRRVPHRAIVFAYPLTGPHHARLRSACARARRRLLVVNLATPLRLTLRGRGERSLTDAERARVRSMHAQGYHRRRFACFGLPNAHPPPARTARTIRRRCLRLVPGPPLQGGAVQA